MKTFLGILLALVFAAVPVFANDAAVAGDWKVSGSVYGNAIDTVCTIKQEGKTLSGTCKMDKADSAVTGTVEGKKVTWQFNSDYQGTAITIVFSGNIDDAAKGISGKINVLPFNVEGDFTAAKEEKKADK